MQEEQKDDRNGCDHTYRRGGRAADGQDAGQHYGQDQDQNERVREQFTQGAATRGLREARIFGPATRRRQSEVVFH